MTVATKAEVRAPAKTPVGWRPARPLAELLIATLFLAWPAIYNGFPLLYPDSMTYLDDGRIVARAIFQHQFSLYYGMRSFFYSLAILPFHWNQSAWPIVALQCFLVAYVLRLVVRAVAPGSMQKFYLGVVCVLAVVSSVGWCASLVLPDILGSLVYLAMYLIVFARESLSRRERWSLYLIAWWGIVSHATHLMVAAALCVLLFGMLAATHQPFRRTVQTIGKVAAIVAMAAAAQVGLNAYLFGHPSLNGDRPPYLMARVIADGPGRMYLEQHCGQMNWAICSHVHQLNVDPDHFLWDPDGIWQSAPGAEQQQMLREELPLVIATFRAYPRQQLRRSAENWWEQLTTFGLNDLDPSRWLEVQFATVMPAAQGSYLRGLQARNALPLDSITSFQFVVVIAALGATAVLMFLFGRRCPPRLVWLSVVAAFVVIANAAVTGTLSMPEDRFESRVIWMVPLVAELFVLAWIDRRGKSLLVKYRRP